MTVVGSGLGTSKLVRTLSGSTPAVVGNTAAVSEGVGASCVPGVCNDEERVRPKEVVGCGLSASERMLETTESGLGTEGVTGAGEASGEMDDVSLGATGSTEEGSIGGAVVDAPAGPDVAGGATSEDDAGGTESCDVVGCGTTGLTSVDGLGTTFAELDTSTEAGGVVDSGTTEVTSSVGLAATAGELEAGGTDVGTEAGAVVCSGSTELTCSVGLGTTSTELAVVVDAAGEGTAIPGIELVANVADEVVA